jgi:GTPase SAR1 family protein
MTEAGLRQAKLVLLGDMGAGKSSLVIRFVKGQYFDHLVRAWREGGRERERK